mgnify:CR=1 FL=1
MGDDRREVRALLQDVILISNPLHRTMIISCWEVAKDRFSARSKMAAEAEASGLPRHRLKGDVKSLKRAYVDSNGRMEDSVTPAANYLEKLLNSIEEEEYDAESLKEVLAKSEEDDADLVPRVGTDGIIKMRTLKKTGKLPGTTEELRSKIEVMSHAWGIVALKHQTRAWLKTVAPKVFSLHVNYILGDHVAGLASKNDSVAVCHTPPMSLIISFVLRLRARTLPRI